MKVILKVIIIATITISSVYGIGKTFEEKDRRYIIELQEKENAKLLAPQEKFDLVESLK